MADQTQLAKSGEDRLLARVDRLVISIRKAKKQLEESPTPWMRERLTQRIEEYQTSLKNIREYRVEKPRGGVKGVKVSIPADVMSLKSEK